MQIKGQEILKHTCFRHGVFLKAILPYRGLKEWIKGMNWVHHGTKQLGIMPSIRSGILLQLKALPI